MNSEDELEDRLTEELAMKPSVAVPNGFAQRVMQHIPSGGIQRCTLVPNASLVARRFGFAALALLTGLMFALVPLAGSTGHGAVTAVEWMLCAELVGVTLWLSPVARLFER